MDQKLKCAFWKILRVYLSKLDTVYLMFNLFITEAQKLNFFTENQRGVVQIFRVSMCWVLEEFECVYTWGIWRNWTRI